MNGEGLKVNGFIYDIQLVDANGAIVDTWQQKNLIPQAGIDFLMLSPFGLQSQIATFYCGLWQANYVPTASTTAADIPVNMGEFVGYSEAQRPVWTPVYDGVGTLDNIASRASFTFTADQLIRGALLVSSPTKGSNSGLLLSALRFPTARQVGAGLTLYLNATLTYIPTNTI